MRPPFAVPPHRTASEVPMCVWYTEPWGMVTRVTGTYTLESVGARFIIDSYLHLAHVCPDPKRRFVFLHDWREAQGYVTEGRKLLMKWGLDIKDRVKNVTICMDESPSPFVKMGLQVATAALAPVGIHIDVLFGKEPADAVRRLGLTPVARV